MQWKSTNSEPAPKDGNPFWGFLFDTGIKAMKFVSAESYADEHGGEAEDYIDAFVEIGDEDEEWSVDFWLPWEALPLPDGVQLVSNRFRPAA